MPQDAPAAVQQLKAQVIGILTSAAASADDATAVAAPAYAADPVPTASAAPELVLSPLHV